MKIAVCVKQVPRLDQIRFHEKTNRVVREGVEAHLNPLDVRALGHALQLRDEAGGEVVAISMGPPAAREVLEEAIRRGADRAVLVSDRRFAGADTLATARALARALEREEVDLALFGRSTLDGGTAQVAPQVAELAGWPQATQAVSLSLEGGVLLVDRETDRGAERLRLALPAAVSVDRGPVPAESSDGRAVDVAELSAEDLGGGPRDYGTRGSPTFVKAVRPVTVERARERVEGVEAGAARIAELLGALAADAGEGEGPGDRDAAREDAVRAGAGGAGGAGEGGAGGSATVGADPSPETADRAHEQSAVPDRRQIWVLAERDGEDLHPVAFEGLACAREAAAAVGGETVAVLICADPGKHPRELAAHRADRVLVVRHPNLDAYATEPFTQALCAAIEERSPFAVIAPWTADGRDYVPRAAARLGLGLTGDFVALEVDLRDPDDPDLLWIKPAWAGTVEAPIIAHTTPSLGTLRPGAVAPAARRAGAEAPIEELDPSLDRAPGGPGPGERRVDHGGPLLDPARTVICAGPDLDEEDVEAARRLAAALGAGFGATSEAVERGLAAPRLEIGILKRSLSPVVCLALGVRDPEALDAVRGARRLVTVHPDPGAPAHERADLAVVGRPGELATALLERLAGAAGRGGG